MKWEELLALVGDEPVFESGLLLAGDVAVADVRRQLSRWVAAGRLYQIRRGLYALAPPFQRSVPHPFVVANRMARGSYVSLQSALAHRGLIPEHVPVTTSVTSGRPGRWHTPLGSFELHHVGRGLFGGYGLEEVAPGQHAYVASPAKALMDLVHLVPGADAQAFLEELRLTDLDRVDLATLPKDLDLTPKLQRAARRIRALAEAEA